MDNFTAIGHRGGRALWGASNQKMRTIIAFILTALPLGSLHAQQPVAITLACSGTASTARSDKPEPVTNVGVIVNLAERSVTLNGHRVPITRADSTMVSFRGGQIEDGSIDRVTGAANLTFVNPQINYISTWDLMCRPATRMF